MKQLNTLSTILLLCMPFIAVAQGDPNEIFDEPEATSAVVTQASSTARSVPPLAAPSGRVVQFYASDKSAELLYEVQGSVFNLNNSRAYASFLFTEERDNALTGSILYDTDLDVFPGLTLSFGTKAFAGLLSLEDADVFGLAVSIEAAYLLPVRQFPLNLTAAANYAPDILTFGLSDRIFDWHVRAGLPLTDNIEGFVGLRFLQFDTQVGDRELDKRLHIGVRWALGN